MRGNSLRQKIRGSSSGKIEDAKEDKITKKIPDKKSGRKKR